MKRRVELLPLLGLMVLSGCAGLGEAPEPGAVPERVELVTPALSSADRESLARIRDALAGQDQDRAGKQLASLERDHRFHPDVLMLRAMLERRRDNPEAATRALEVLLDQRPGTAAAINDLALLYREQGRIRQAAELLGEGLEAHPDNPRLNYNLAVLSELYLMDLEQALTHYQRYQSLSEGKDEEVALWIRDLERRVE